MIYDVSWYFQVMGGRKSADFAEYQRQCTQALLVARKHAKQVKALMEMMAYHSSYPAFRCASCLLSRTAAHGISFRQFHSLDSTLSASAIAACCC